MIVGGDVMASAEAGDSEGAEAVDGASLASE